MAIGIYFAPTSMTVAQYTEIVQRLKQAGAGHPKGRRYHACFGDADKLQVFDVWDSQGDFGHGPHDCGTSRDAGPQRHRAADQGGASPRRSQASAREEVEAGQEDEGCEEGESRQEPAR